MPVSSRQSSGMRAAAPALLRKPVSLSSIVSSVRFSMVWLLLLRMPMNAESTRMTAATMATVPPRRRSSGLNTLDASLMERQRQLFCSIA